MPRKHLVTEETLNKALEEAEENDRDVEAIRKMYVTPDEALGQVFRKTLHWGRTFYEAVDVNREEEELILSELFTDREFTEPFGEILETPLLGSEFEVSWIEAKVDSKWERVSSYATPGDWRSPHIPRDEDYEETRVVKKTYEHGADQYDSWPIRVDRQTGEPEIVIGLDDTRNSGLLKQVLDSIELPDSFDLGGLVIGTVYTEEKIKETENGHKKEYEVVWWRIDSQFQPSNHRRISPVKKLDKTPV